MSVLIELHMLTQPDFAKDDSEKLANLPVQFAALKGFLNSFPHFIRTNILADSRMEISSFRNPNTTTTTKSTQFEFHKTLAITTQFSLSHTYPLNRIATELLLKQVWYHVYEWLRFSDFASSGREFFNLVKRQKQEAGKYNLRVHAWY